MNTLQYDIACAAAKKVGHRDLHVLRVIVRKLSASEMADLLSVIDTDVTWPGLAHFAAEGDKARMRAADAAR